MIDTSLPAPRIPDRVREHSPANANADIDLDSLHCLNSLAGAEREAITRHIRDLDQEWDVERYLQLNASVIALTGLTLGAGVDRRFFVLPGLVLGFFLQHAVQGWCPPIEAFRRMGVRTRQEINREKYALKALRGDFQDIDPAA